MAWHHSPSPRETPLLSRIPHWVQCRSELSPMVPFARTLPLATKRIETPKAQPNLVRVKVTPIVHAVSNGGS
jgi:hypothetical protein